MPSSNTSSLTDASDSLTRDADFRTSLQRVAFAEGMLLGLEATRDEQDYHRRRLNRHQAWFHGVGTVAGLNVTLDYQKTADAQDASKTVTVRVVISPGFAVDGLGREFTVDTRYCLNLNEWLEAHDNASLGSAYDAAAQKLYLTVAARYEPCPRGLQPVLARQLNSSTDAVDFSRIGDGFHLELVADDTLGVPTKAGYRADGLGGWQRSLPNTSTATSAMNDDEKLLYQAVVQPDAKKQMELRARLLHAFDTDAPATTNGDEPREDVLALARIPLAAVTLSIPSLANRIVSPKRLTVNNLIRPFALPVNAAALIDNP
jgi:hypothetical protein